MLSSNVYFSNVRFVSFEFFLSNHFKVACLHRNNVYVSWDGMNGWTNGGGEKDKWTFDYIGIDQRPWLNRTEPNVWWIIVTIYIWFERMQILCKSHANSLQIRSTYEDPAPFSWIQVWTYARLQLNVQIMIRIFVVAFGTKISTPNTDINIFARLKWMWAIKFINWQMKIKSAWDNVSSYV